MKEFPVLDKGFVRLDGVLADDISVVNGARVSFAKHIDEMGDSDHKLIHFLMRERHGSPFEHNCFRFHIKAPIFVAREWFRHRIGSFNEWSGRYSKLESDFYIPATHDVRTQEGKPGAYSFVPVEESLAESTQDFVRTAYERAWADYEEMLDNGIAKELARMVLPVGIYTQWIWTVNARSLMNFLSLRNSEFALHEIREYAKVVEEVFATHMPTTYSAFLESGRIAP